MPSPATAPETSEDDPRLGRWLARQRNADGARVVVVGFPSDEGVRRNGGRPGAADGPAAIREALYKLTPDAEHPQRFGHLLDQTADLGDVRVTGDVEGDQERLGAVLGPLLEANTIPVVLGGGHETTYGHFLGYVAARRDTAVLNWDAHLDVRAVGEAGGHSGSPFRQALEHPSGRCRRYVAAGLQPHGVAATHLTYVRQRGGRCVWRGDLDTARVGDLVGGLTGSTLATFDLDAVEAAAAPGVSAPNPSGLPVDVWLRAAYGCGRSLRVGSMDVVELNPRFDVDSRTARLAALTVWWFLKGVADR
ncbi:MAG: formimidoylglutamase [Rhodothermales bacterium]|nr:formimidoylglutamase [Rhodothermales bacterium]